MKQYISYSELALLERDKDEYYRVYIKGEEQEENEAMKVGKIIHKTIEDSRYDWLKELREMGFTAKRLIPIRKALNKLETKKMPEREVGYRAKLNDINLFCVFDGFDKENKAICDYKTSIDGNLWNQKMVDFNKQLSFYALAWHLNTHGFFKEMILYAVDLDRGNVKTFKTARGVKDIFDARRWVEGLVNEIKRAGLWEKRLTREERSQIKLQINEKEKI